MRVTPAAIIIISKRYINAAYIGLGHDRPVDMRQFKSFFRLCPVGVARLWYALEETCSACIHCDGVGPPLSFTTVQPEHLLLCLHFMKTYCSVSCGASLFGLSEKLTEGIFGTWSVT